MSWDMWHVCGIGFDLDCASTENKLSFVENHKQILDEDRYNDIVEVLKDEEYDPDRLFAYFLVEVIRRENDITCEAPGIDIDNSNVEPIIYVPKYPWEMSGKERMLSESDIYSILGKYANTLGIHDVYEMDCVYSG